MMHEKPFIHLLRSPNSGYFFDVNRNEIVPIDEEIFSYLLSQQQNAKVTNLNPSVKAKIDSLESKGYLSNHKVKKIEHPEVANLIELLENRLGMICLQVTQNCNLRCEYCIYSETNNTKQRTHSNTDMNITVAKQAIDFMYKRSKDAGTVAVGLYGGEPLIGLPLIKEIIKYSEEIFDGRELIFNMTTNATLLTPDVVDYLYAHRVSLTISLDGPKSIHDKHRRFKDAGSFDRLLQNINYIAIKYPDMIPKMFISMVIDRENDFDEINSVFKKFPVFEQMSLIASTIDDTYSENKTVISEQYSAKSEYQTFIGLLHMFGRLERKQVSPIVFTSVSRIFEKKLEMESSISLPEITSPGGPCVAGNRRLFCNVDGNLYPCERVSESSPIMKIGTLADGFNYDAIRNMMNVADVTKDKCVNCWAFTHCTQCIRGADGEDHIDREVRLSYCNSVLAEAHQFLRNIIMIHEAEYLY